MLDISTGTVLSDRYTVGQQLGVGGTGVVWQASDGVLDREVALKVVRNGEHARLAREAKAAARVNDRNVVAVYDAGEDDGTVFLVMELVQGVDLGQVLRVNGPLPADVATLVGRELARGLGAVHEQGIIHRDIKPSNVLITAQGQVKLSDLGIARTSDATQTVRLTETGTIVGTIDYLAPEQLADQDVTAATDVYALGLLLLEVCTGDKPFGEGTLAERAARRLAQSPEPPAYLHEDLRAAIARAVRRDPAERPADGHAFADELLRSVVDEEAARAEIVELVKRTAAAPEEDRLHDASPVRSSGSDDGEQVLTEEYTPTGVHDAPEDVVAGQASAANGSRPTRAAGHGTDTDDATLLAGMPTPGRVAAEALGLAGVVALAVAVAAALFG